jgi:AcrR family transcriptional regulator
MYYHFDSKEEIVVEIMNMGAAALLEEVQRRVNELPPKSPFKKKFERAVDAHIACKVDANIPYMRVYEHLPPIIKRESRTMRHRYADFWVTLLNEAKKTGEIRSDLDLDVFVPFFLAGLNRIPEWFNSKKVNQKRVSQELTNTFLQGIKRPGTR